MDESILFFSNVSLSKFFLKALFSTLHLVGIRVFIVGCEMECKKIVFSKIGCSGNSLGNWNKSRVIVASYQTSQTVLFVL